MAQTSGSGGIGSLAIGGVAGVVVIVAGIVLVQLGVFDKDEPADRQELREGQQGETAISPSASAPVVLPRAEQAETEVTTDSPVDVAQDPAPETSTQVEPDGVVAEDTAAEEGGAETKQAETAAAPAEDAEQPAATEQDAAVQSASTDPAETASQDSSTSDATASADPAEEQPASEAMPTLAPPRLDLVRVDPDGAVVIAGQAEPGAEISVLLDGTLLEQTAAQGSGEFVIFTSIVPSQQPRVISLLARLGDQEAVSADQFILAPAAPMPAPQVADAPVPQPESDATAAQADAPLETAAADQTAAVEEAEVAAAEPEQPAKAAPEQPEDTRAAEETAPPVEAASEAPDQPATATGAGVAIETAQNDARPVETEAPRSDPAQSEPQADAETEPAPQPQTAAVAVLRAGADGVELVQPAAPVLGGKVALDTISYSESGEVLLAGRGRAGALVRAYVNNVLKGELLIGEDSRWGGALAGVEPGIYTLRLDEVDRADGAVLSRLETPFKREAPEVLQLPAQEPGASPDQPVPLVRAITVQKGDTLWAISQERYGSGFLYVRVFEANQDAIRDPDLIYPGQVFNLPE